MQGKTILNEGRITTMNVIYYRHQQHLISSSSVHTIVLFPKDYPTEERAKGSKFGWDPFLLVSEEKKKQYVAIASKEAMIDRLGRDVVELVLSGWFGALGKKMMRDDTRCYIDHESLPVMPRKHGSKLVNLEFVDDFLRFLSQENMAILGGNDNVPEKVSHPGQMVKMPLPVDRPEINDFLVARKDLQGFWILFNQKTGTQIMFSFLGERIDSTPVTHFQYEFQGSICLETDPAISTFPVGIDLKITDRCYRNCEYCYEGSCASGRHAEVDWYLLLEMMREMEIFEVCIGGGEPLLSPDFIPMLHKFREYDIVPSFTTREVEWLRDGRRSEILESCGSFAISIDASNFSTIEVIDRVSTSLDYHNVEKSRCAIQVVMGTFERSMFSPLIERCREHSLKLSLLGYKNNIGRSGAFESIDYSDWLPEELAELGEKRKEGVGYANEIVIDTVLAGQIGESLKKMEIPRFCWDDREGRFTCFVDLVKGKMAVSSTMDRDRHGVNLPIYEENAVSMFGDIWREMKRERGSD